MEGSVAPTPALPVEHVPYPVMFGFDPEIIIFPPNLSWYTVLMFLGFQTDPILLSQGMEWCDYRLFSLILALLL